MKSNENVNPVFKGVLDSIYKPEPQKDQYTKAGIYAHTTCVLSGKYPYMHKTPDNEDTFVAGYLKGLQDGIALAQDILKEPTEAPTLERQDEIKIVLDEENAKTLHY